MGFLLIGTEDNAEGGLPPVQMELIFKDGSKEDLEVFFDTSDETITGGGGAIMPSDPKHAPLVTEFSGERNPDGALVIRGQFSRILNPDSVETLVVNGQEFLFSHN